MYNRILVAVEHSPSDQTIIEHATALAGMTGGCLILLHVADGWAARHYNELQLRESEEMIEDRRYLQSTADAIAARGLPVEWHLAMGDPAQEIVAKACEYGADLIAMSTHGHRGVSDLIYGSTVSHVRHSVDIPVLLVRHLAERVGR